jgi:hypothetical protein
VATESGNRYQEPSAYSVGKLLRIRMGDDRWDLALVQRDEVWGPERMQRLLDSLLAGYPIGALLLCRTTKRPSKVIDRDGDEERVRDASERAWQLLDGQQRINALYTMLTDADDTHRKAYGHFYLDLTVQRQPPSPAGAGTQRGTPMPYLVWHKHPDGPLDAEGNNQKDDKFPAERGRCLNLSRLYEWAELEGGIGRASALLAAGPELLAHEIDPGFTHALDADGRDVAEGWLRQILRIWTTPIVPVMQAEVDAPQDILELFARLNRSGVSTHNDDIYFAAVKTFWPEAGPRLKLVVEASKRPAGATENGHALLTLKQALRLISRLAGRSLGRDVIPLTVERIAGDNGDAMIDAMRALTTMRQSPALDRLIQFFHDYPTASRLKYGLRFVREQLWDEVLAWAVARGHWDAADLQIIDSYLLGATLFQYPTVLGDAFSRRALAEALAAGLRDEPFPMRAILYATRNRFGDDLKRARRQVRALRNTEENEDDRWYLANERGNVSLLLSIAQQIDVDHGRPLDIDHIYATAHARKMHAPGKRRRHHEHRWLVNTIGNMWLLDAGTNRALQDQAPRRKFGTLSDRLHARRDEVWPTSQWSISESEVKQFEEVDETLKRSDDEIDAAMNVFAELVWNREKRLLESPFELLPDAKLFARDTELEVPDEWDTTDPSPAELAQRLGLPNVEHERPERPVPGSDVGAVRRQILDVPRRFGWPHGWRTEFAYIEFGAERWEERNIKTLYNRTFRWLWANRREDLLRWNKEKKHDGVIAGPGLIGRWDRLDDEHYLQMGLFYRYLLGAVQEVLEALGLADGVHVVYANAND